ncbi:hypothetical protein QG37_00890 [Candidozyma auris]|uniref:Uncharacterized protein n=1 Tax=Candidozyma auris TaxID=498019 RepID=A0A0L0P6T2_CANAR|nr:hypothetical protein QG37_00890 [[Candida] auris]
MSLTAAIYEVYKRKIHLNQVLSMINVVESFPYVGRLEFLKLTLAYVIYADLELYDTSQWPKGWHYFATNLYSNLTKTWGIIN